jgi:hypothetical protein
VWRYFFRNPYAMIRSAAKDLALLDGGGRGGDSRRPGRESQARATVTPHFASIDDAIREASHRVVVALERGLSQRAIADLKFPSALSEFGITAGRGLTTRALELVPALFVSCLDQFLPGRIRSGKELIGDGTTTPDGSSSYYIQWLQVTLMTGRQVGEFCLCGRRKAT